MASGSPSDATSGRSGAGPGRRRASSLDTFTLTIILPCFASVLADSRPIYACMCFLWVSELSAVGSRRVRSAHTTSTQHLSSQVLLTAPVTPHKGSNALQRLCTPRSAPWILLVAGSLVLPATLRREAYIVAIACTAGLLIRAGLVALFRAEPPTDGKYRILIVGDSIAPKIDGVATRTTKACELLPKWGHSIHILTSARSEPLLGLPVTRLPGIVPSFYPQHSLTLPGFAMVTTLFRFRPHVVHLFDENIVNAFMVALCALVGVPTVFSHHTRVDLLIERYVPQLATLGLHRLALRALQRWLGGLSSGHLTVGEDMRLQLLSAGCTGVRPWSVGCDMELFKPSVRDEGRGVGSMRWELTGGRPDLRIILYVGRVSAEKGLDLLPAVIDAMNCGGGTDGGSGSGEAHFVVVGDGPFLGELRALCGARRRVTFLGPLEHVRWIASKFYVLI